MVELTLNEIPCAWFIRLVICFSDVTMPGSMDGFGLSKWIRRYRPGLPVLLTSGYNRKASDAVDLCEGQATVPKPYSLHQLLGRIRTVIEQRNES